MKGLNVLEEIIARNDFLEFARYVMPELEFTEFHLAYYSILNYFAQGEIKRLIVSVPPQHGKSLGSSQLLPSFMLGCNPNLNIAIASYNATLAHRFNKRVQRIMSEESYRIIYPDSKLKNYTSSRKEADSAIQTSSEFDIVGHKGSLMSVGREAGLTGNKVDVMIMDDLYKDAKEANSPLIRDNCWEWYTDVVKTRMHNDSQELIVFTRWHEEDLIGTLLEKQPHVRLTKWEQIESLDPSHWLVVNFEAIKESPPTEIDGRRENSALWGSRHSLENLEAKRNLDVVGFECLYQGNPSNKEGRLYGEFNTYAALPNSDQIIKRANYTDTADQGEDYLCSICYVVDKGGKIYITDVLYTGEPMEVTESATALLLERNDTRIAYIESNNGGRGFARVVARMAKRTKVEWFHQSQNKESRIKTNSATVMNSVYMPSDWKLRWGEFYKHLATYRNEFRANKRDDAADVLTGIVEKEVIGGGSKVVSYW